jgi:hypothetical protein
LGSKQHAQRRPRPVSAPTASTAEKTASTASGPEKKTSRAAALRAVGAASRGVET